MSSVVITGCAGLLGSALLQTAPPGTRCVGVVHHRVPLQPIETVQIDLTDERSIAEMLEAIQPDLVIHTAYDPNDLERSVRQAGDAIAGACAQHQVRLIAMSTDLIFDGSTPLCDERTRPAPLSTYGEAKVSMEGAVLNLGRLGVVVRTSLLVSVDPLDGASRWLVDGLLAGEPVTLFTDEFRTPIWVDDAARQIWLIAERPEASGVWHLPGPELISRYELGIRICDLMCIDPTGVIATSSEHLSGRPGRLEFGTVRAGSLGYRPRQIGRIADMARHSGDTLKVGDRVRSTTALPGVPNGTPGRVMLVNGIDWLRYRVWFDTEAINGTDVGSLHRHQLQRVDRKGDPVDKG